MYLNKRKLIEQEVFDLTFLQKLMRSLFPKKNDCASISDLEEAAKELKKFDIVTKKQLRLSLKKHRKWLIKVDKEPIDSLHQRIYRKDIGDVAFLDAIRRQYWFCYPAFIRNAMEVEFGEKYEVFANARDQT